MSNQVITKTNDICKQISSQITSRRDKIVSLLGKSGIDFDYFQLILTANFFNKNKHEQIQNLNIPSFLYAVYSCAQHKLLPDNREATFTLFKNNTTGKYDVTYISMYYGLLRIVIQTGLFEKFEARVVYEKDEFEIDYQSEPHIKHKMFISKNGESKGKIIYAYALLKFKNSNDILYDVIDTEAIEKIKNASQAYKNDKNKTTPWNKWPAEMWKKSIGKKLLKSSLCYIPFDQNLFDAVNETPVVSVQDDELEDFTIIDGQSNKLNALADVDQENELFPHTEQTGEQEHAV